jgi:hypothetical protein
MSSSSSRKLSAHGTAFCPTNGRGSVVASDTDAAAFAEGMVTAVTLGRSVAVILKALNAMMNEPKNAAT